LNAAVLRLLDLAASQTRGTDFNSLDAAADLCLDLYDIWFPNASGFIVSVADIVARYSTFTANFTPSCHIYIL